MYGLTETKRTLYLPPEQLDRRPARWASPSRAPRSGWRTKRASGWGPAQVGELVVRGRHVMRGYWERPGGDRPALPARAVPGERLCYTGDLFRMDEEGFLYFVGRKDDIIKSRGEKVAPKEVENVLYGLPGVVEAAVVGVPDPSWARRSRPSWSPRAVQLTRGRRSWPTAGRTWKTSWCPSTSSSARSCPRRPSGKIKKTDSETADDR